MNTSFVERDAVPPLADKLVAAGRFVGLLGVVLVLLSIGGLKFTQVFSASSSSRLCCS